MRLTILGNHGSTPGPGGACSGYLIEEQGTRILLDCGNGVLSRLQRFYRVEDLAAILLSHLHFDHMADLLVLRYGLETRLELGESLNPIPFFRPETPADVLAWLESPRLFDPHPIQPGLQARIGPFSLQWTPMLHSVECYATRIEANGKTLVFSGDTMVTPRLVQAALRADLFLCEATMADESLVGPGKLPHLASSQAAEIAAEAGVGRLLLTHLWLGQDRENVLAKARAVFETAELSEELQSYEV